MVTKYIYYSYNFYKIYNYIIHTELFYFLKLDIYISIL